MFNTSNRKTIVEKEFAKVIDLIYLAKKAGIEIILNNERLQLRVPENTVVDNVLLQEIRSNKNPIIEFLSNADWHSKNLEHETTKIPKFDRDTVTEIPLSFSQERLWFIDQLEGSTQYHVPVVLRLKGNLNYDALKYAFETVIDRHEVLRTIIYEKNGQPYQRIKEIGGWHLPVVDGHSFGETDSQLKQYITELIVQPFDLAKDHLLRASLIKLDEYNHLLVVTVHHIASDGWSTQVMVREVAELYNAFIANRRALLPTLAVQYSDYSVWQRTALEPIVETKLRYWENKLHDVSPLQFLSDYPRHNAQTNRSAVTTFAIDKELCGKLHLLSNQHGVTLFMTLLAAFKILLYRHTGQQDICVGTPIAGRQHRDLEGLIGFFINTLALRTQIQEDVSFSKLVHEVKQTTLEAYEHQEVPFEKVVDTVVKQRSTSIHPLFQVMFILQNTPQVPEFRLGEVHLFTENIYQRSTTLFDLTFIVTETNLGLEGKVEYNSGLYAEATVERLVSHFKELLDSISMRPDDSVARLKMLGAEEQDGLVINVTNTVAPYGVLDLIEQQSVISPEAVALIFENQMLTYKELDERSNQLAHYLEAKGVKSDSLVPKCVERSVEMVVGILGILKSGSAYVPVDPEYPRERISFILADTSASVVLTSKGSSCKISEREKLVIIELDTAWPEIRKQPVNGRKNKVDLSQLAYVIYTSGSTGKPKGVMIEHGSLAASMIARKDYYKNLGSVFLIPSFAFDSSIAAVFGSLISGGSLLLCKEEETKDAVKVQRFLRQSDTILCVPSYYRFLLQEGLLEGSGISKVIVGGEKLDLALVSLHYKQTDNVALYNEYGPTEATVWSTVSKIEPGAGQVTIGRPISTVSAYITDAHLQLVPIGVPGELCIGGVQVARGYLNLPDLTKEKFTEDIFSDQKGGRMYRTGDICRWLADGTIEYLGRGDDQVKIRGYRVELAEIEAAILSQQDVSQAVVVAREHIAGNQQLVAYVVATNFDQQKVAGSLAERLPDYMIPTAWVRLDKMPLTANGKIDKKSLPDPGLGEGTVAYVAPQTGIETRLVAIWQHLLGIERVGIHDNFFELGGHSLLAVRLVSAARKEFAVEISIRDVFSSPTIGLLAARIESSSARAGVAVQKIDPRPGRIPLSFSQERLWFIDRFEGSVQYHMPAVLRLEGVLNVQALEYALKSVVSRHEVLRTVIREQEGIASQQVKETGDGHLAITDGSLYDKNIEGLQEYIKQIISKPFDLSKDDMLRATLIRVDTEEHILVITMHHIASDGWSISILVREVMEVYQSCQEERDARLPALEIQYADYAIWQRSAGHEEVIEKKIAYWKNKLEGVEPLILPTDYARPVTPSRKGSRMRVDIDRVLTEQLHQLSQRSSVTLFMTLLASIKVLLYRYSGQQDICVGTPVAGRPQQELEGLIGSFINTLALRSEVQEESTFTELLRKVKQTTLEAYEHQEVPFEKVVDRVVKRRDMGRHPLFQVMLILQNTPPVPELQLGQLRLSPASFERGTGLFDLTFTVAENKDGLGIEIEYNTDLYRAQTIENLAGHFRELLQSITSNPEKQVGQLKMLTAKEEQQLLQTFNDTTVPYDASQSIVDLLEAQAKQTPGAIAVVFGEQRLTYKELDERSSQLAHYLRKRGVKEEQLVPICVDRSLEMIIGVVGIMKSGAAYVPVDPAYPQERISYVLEDTGAVVMVSSKEGRSQLINAGQDTEIISLDEDREAIEQESTQKPNQRVTGQHLAYVIYTSGSTGKPKGVMVEHHSVVNLLQGIASRVGFTPASSILSVTTYSFDISYLEFYMPLVSGGRLIIADRNTASDGFGLAKMIAETRPTHMQATPATWQLLLDGGWQNAERVKILTGGEAIREELKEKLVTGGADLWNVYGPTETTIWSTIERLEEGKKVTIGKPINNTGVYILGKSHQLCGVMIPGEICIGGAGVARGYWKQPELTKEKFIDHPFSKEQKARVYKTGDTGRWLSDGRIEYLGRRDEQVKIRGYRIELGEIEETLQEAEGIKQVAVVARETTPGNKQLVAYVVAAEEFNREEITGYLRQRLPEYMIPSVWMTLESLPLTPNGKTDKKSLPAADASGATAHQYVAPRTETEIKLVEIWQELLGVERIGIYDNFFELGGHSLVATRAVSAVRSRLHAELAIRDMFVHPTIADLSKYLDQQNKRLLLPSIEIGHRPDGWIPLSFAQERLWFIDKLEGSVQYHIPAVLRFRGELNTVVLQNAFQQVVNRHESLRTIVVEDNGHPYQKIIDRDKWRMTVLDKAGQDNDPEFLRQTIVGLISRRFDLSSDHMLRAALITLKHDDHVLVVTMHHIASDAWSLSVLVREIGELYTSEINHRPARLPMLPVQYADFAIWQRNHLQGDVLASRLSYWKEKLGGVSQLDIPTDFARPPIQSIKGATFDFSVERDLLSQIRLLSQQQGATLFMTLLAVFKVLLHRHSAQEDICVGTPIAGRQQQEIENLVGLFVNTLALRSEVRNDIPFIDLLQQVKQTTLEAYENQDMPFDKVVEAVVKERDLSRSPLFQVMFALQNIPEMPAVDLGQVQLSAEVSQQTTTKFDLTLNISETKDGLKCTLEYCTDLFAQSTIARMASHFNELLRAVVANPMEIAGRLSMLTVAEKKLLLNDFNDTFAEIENGKTIVDLVEDQVNKMAGKTALVFGDYQLSYKHLNERSNQVANYLRSHGITSNTVVAIFIERGIEMIIGILGVLKSGAAYLPIDPEYPEERVSYMIEDSGVSMVICSKASQQNLPLLRGVEIIDLDVDNLNINAQSSENLKIDIQPQQLAYVIYTSGSTGKPKGVMIEHRNVYSFICWSTREFASSNFDIAYASTSVCFDLSVFEMFYPLSIGKRVRIISDVQHIGKFLQSDQDVLLNTVPSVIQLLLKEGTDLSNVRVLNMAGEPIPLPVIKALDADAFEIRNLYGPTETTTYSTAYRIHPGSGALIGKPISNTQVYVLNKMMDLVPIGSRGEICIAGAGVTRGYLNRSEMTSQKFVANPFDGDPGARLYKTGDIGRWLPDGNLECFGRADEQVKIRGFRIELGEIEDALRQHEQVNQAAVTVRIDGNGNQVLTGYIVPNGPFAPEDISSYLKTKLPRYMIPVQWIEIQQLPLNPNGKVDKKALPRPNADELFSTEYLAPRNDVEVALSEIWKRLLNREQIGITENFFEAGGHSLLAVQLISILRTEFNLELPLVDIFDRTTIQSLAERILKQSESGKRTAVRTQVTEEEAALIARRFDEAFVEEKGPFGGPNGERKFMIPIKEDGKNIPLFGILSFKQLRILSDYIVEDQPLYYLPPTQVTSVEEIAAHYIHEIKSVQPVGPYVIGGYCGGGKIALEVAQKLLANGDEVSALVLFELYGPNTVLSPRSFKFLKRKMRYYKERFISMNSDYSYYDMIRFILHKSFGNVTKPFKKAPPPKFIRTNAYSNYTYKPYPGRVVLFQATMRPLEIDDSPLMGWSDYFTGEVDLISISGGHLGMFREPAIRKTAEQLSEVLKKINK